MRRAFFAVPLRGGRGAHAAFFCASFLPLLLFHAPCACLSSPGVRAPAELSTLKDTLWITFPRFFQMNDQRCKKKTSFGKKDSFFAAQSVEKLKNKKRFLSEKCFLKRVINIFSPFFSVFPRKIRNFRLKQQKQPCCCAQKLSTVWKTLRKNPPFSLSLCSDLLLRTTSCAYGTLFCVELWITFFDFFSI